MTSSGLQCHEVDLAPEDPISGRYQNPPPPLELINGEEEYVVERILNSRMFQWRLQYIIKCKGYGMENNTWKYAENVDNAPEKIANFHRENLAVPHHIYAMAVSTIPFHPISLTSTSD